jgi:hypothetical protein
MSGKSAKRLRRTIKKFNNQVFKDFTVEISAMPFWQRFKFCVRMAFLRHELQRGLKPEIEARRKYNTEGQER